MTVLVVVGIVAGFVLRIWLLRTNMGTVDYDEAIVGLMARHTQHGHPTMFFWGQSYGGTAEPLMVAGLFSIFGRGVLALKVVPIALHGLAAILTWRVGIRVLDRPRAALSGLLLWCFPASFVWWSTKERGFYGLTLVLGLTAVLLCCRLAERESRADFVGLGLVAGVGLWISPQTSFLALPATLWLFVGHRELIRKAWPALIAALVAAIPWAIWNLTNHWKALTLPRNDAVQFTYFERIRDFWHRMPMVFGLEEPFSGRHLLPGPGWLRILVAAGLLLAGTWLASRHRSQVAGATPKWMPGLLWWLTIGCSLLYAVNALIATNDPHPRYMYLFLPVAALALAALASTELLRFGMLAAAILASAWGLGVMHGVATQTAGWRDLAPGPINELIHTLDRKGIDRVITDHVGPQLTFATDERIIGSTYTNERQPAYAAAAEARPVPVYVLETREGNVQPLLRRLRRHHIGYRLTTVGPWTIIEPSRRILPPS